MFDENNEHLGTVETMTSSGFAPVNVSSVVDTDGDGLSDLFEDELGTIKNDPDSDNDVLTDGEETNADDSDMDDTLTYTGNTAHIGGIIGAISALLFVLFKRIG